MNSIVEQLVTAPVLLPPSPWRKVGEYAIGGLLAIGYAPQSDYLLVASSQGRGVFDVAQGEKVARDADTSNNWLNEIQLTAIGIGPISSQVIRIGGLLGGGLPLMTHDGWRLEVVTAPWPQTNVFLVKPHASLYQQAENGIKVAVSGACEFRAAGFSETGNSFAVATSCDLTLFSRLK
jgi:hypothetical protein